MIIREFVKFAANRLRLKKIPGIKIIRDSDYSASNHTFGHYDPNTGKILVQIQNRQIVDILRTLAHELVHAGQDGLGRLKPESGETGSREENQANALAGVLMREFTKKHPELFGRIPE